MTDNEIIKALEYCISDGRCKYCPYYETSCLNQTRNALDLINRQKAEIERLKDKVKRLQESVRLMLNYDDGDERIKAEAIKEFAERLKERKYLSSEWSHGEHPYVVEEDDIDDLLEEMTEEKK